MATTTPTSGVGTATASTASTASGQAPAGPNQGEANPQLAAQIADLNFYLRRVSLGGNGDTSQIEYYGGGPDYEMFLDAVESFGTLYGWSEAQTIRTVEMKLKDKAREYYGALLPGERPKTMVELKNWFRRVFERKLTISAGKRELERCIRNPGETLGEFAQRLKVRANKMFPATSLIAGERLYHRNLLLVNQFIEGLEGRLANEVLRAGEFYNLDDCLVVAEQCEDIVSRMIPETRYDIRMSAIRRVEMGTAGRQENRNNLTERQEDPRTSERRQRQPGYAPDRNNVRAGSTNYAPRPNVPFGVKYPYMRNRCTRCGEEGHYAMRCSGTKLTFCFCCGRVGEICSLNSQRREAETPR